MSHELVAAMARAESCPDRVDPMKGGDHGHHQPADTVRFPPGNIPFAPTEMDHQNRKASNFSTAGPASTSA